MARLSAGVRKRSDGIFEKRFTIKGKRFSVYGKTAKEIENKEQELRERIKNNTYINNKNITLDKYFEYWFKEHAKSVKGSTMGTYRFRYYNHISKELGDHKLQTLEKREIVSMQNSMLENGLTPTTANNAITLLKNILKDAIRDEIITISPAANIRKIKIETKKASETIHRALTEEEQKIFMQEMKKDFYYEIVALMICSGLRIGEAAALKWSDIDYVNNVIHINKTIARDINNKITLNTPKSAAGKRDIPLTPNIKQILKQAKEKNILINGNVLSIDNRVFCTPYGKTVCDGSVNRAIDKAISNLQKQGVKIERISAHALRDTFATRFIEQGGTPQTLKTILGHSTLSMTMDLYAHVLPNTKQEEMQRINIVI